jgi:hypothetical protein
MATTAKVLARGTLTDANATLYTVPAATKAVVTNIALCNTGAAANDVTLELDGVLIFDDVEVAVGTTIFVDLRQVLDANDLIEGLASTTAEVTYHISGVEIS